MGKDVLEEASEFLDSHYETMEDARELIRKLHEEVTLLRQRTAPITQHAQDS